MTRKDYQKFADMLKSLRMQGEEDNEPNPYFYALNRVESMLCNILINDNHRFDRERFIEASNRKPE